MPSDANIFQAYLQAPKSVTDYSNDYAKADALRTTNALQALNLQQQTDTTAQALAERNALRNIAATSGGDRQALITGLRNSGMPGLMTQADSLEQSGAKLQESQATAAMHTATAGKTTQETQIAGHAQHLQALSTVNNPQDAMQWIVDGVRSGSLPAAGLQPALERLQQASANPQAFAQWKQQTQAMGLTVQQQLEQVTPKPTEMRLGNVVKTIDMNPRSPSFGKEVVGQQAIGTSPDTVATNATHVQTTAMTNATSRANNRDTIAGENMRAGTSADGSVSPEVEAQAQAIAKGQLLPPSGAALINPKNARVLARVMEINPTYDATSVLAKRKAASDFATGSQGNSMRSFAVAGQHLDQLGTLVDALDNGNTQLVNKIGNAYSQQTGNPAVTNFDAAKDVVSKEVVKAIVAGGGGVAEREELSKLMDNAKSPKQLKGVIQQYRSLMAAQHDALLQQRDAAGLPRSTLPNYTDANGSAAAPTVPPDIASILQKHGGK